MAQEDHSKRHSNNSGGGSGGGSGGNNRKRSKKLKPYRVPQRGLGVAQLEKLRLEDEQRKKDASSSILPPTNSGISQRNFSNCLPLPPPLSLDPNVLDQTSHVPLPKAMDSGSGGGGEVGGLMGGWGGWPPKLMNGESSNEVEGDNSNRGFDDQGGFSFMKNVLPYESNYFPTQPMSNVVQQEGTQYYQQQQPCFPSMVNNSKGTSNSAASASLLNFQMETPSNQTNNGKNIVTPSLWFEEEKTAGKKKRSYPFSSEEEQIPSFHCKFPSSFGSPISISDESASCYNGSKSSIEPATHQVISEEGPSSNTIVIPILSPVKVVRDNGGCHLDGDFLTLGPPGTHYSKRPKLINFFPPPAEETQNEQINGRENGEVLDLNLKL